MLWLQLSLLTSLTAYSCVGDSQSLPEGYSGVQQANNLSTNNPCITQSPVFSTDFCVRCNWKGITNAKKCIYNELGQDTPDGATYRQTAVGGPTGVNMDGQPILNSDAKNQPYTMTHVMFKREGVEYFFRINIDSCRRVNWTMAVGPLDVAKQAIHKAGMNTIVN